MMNLEWLVFLAVSRLQSDRILWAFGSSYQVSDSLNLDVAYVHIFSADSTIDNSTAAGRNLNGKFESNADIISLGLNWKF